MAEKKIVEVEGVLAIGSLLLFAVIALVVIFHTVPGDNEKYAMLMLGALIGIVKDTFGRYFQATKGAQEQRKDAAEVTRALAAGSVAATEHDPAEFGGPRP